MAEQPRDEEPLVFSDQVETVPSRSGVAPEAGMHSDNIDAPLAAAAPNLAVAGMLSQANAHGSPKAKRQARVLAWAFIAIFVLVVVGMLLSSL